AVRELTPARRDARHRRTAAAETAGGHLRRRDEEYGDPCSRGRRFSPPASPLRTAHPTRGGDCRARLRTPRTIERGTSSRSGDLGAQLVLEQLARGMARQVIGDDDLAGQLVAGELVGQVVPQLLDAELRTVDGG